ncbi:MAG: hypothetical protein HWE22_19645 [Flavobacteriales bacterium]|nr:hypothetical protein [Flavobacteriales bacterium]
MRPSLSEISSVLFNPQSSLDEVQSALNAYKTCLLNASRIDFSEREHQQHLQLNTGIAIGLNWAASCLDDHIRTLKFIRGTKNAINQKLEEGIQPVRLVYAGTGPFATLIFPLLDQFSSEELQVTLIEINPNSAKNVKHLVESLGFERHVEGVFVADATSVLLPLPNTRKSKKTNYDILLSETMQHALQAELQVVICANLLSQMPTEALLIPQSIDLDLIRMQLEAGNFRSVERIGELMWVDADFLRREFPVDTSWQFKKQFDLSKVSFEPEEFLGISTSIRVFEDEIIHENESGLTVPKMLISMEDVQEEKLEFTYKIDPDPGFVYKKLEGSFESN